MPSNRRMHRGRLPTASFNQSKEHQQMATNPPKRCRTGDAPKPNRSVIQWLLDSDPSIRWQAMRDLIGAPAEEVAAERARVATEGAGARLLALQRADGSWAGAAWNRGCDSTMHVLSRLRELGLDPASDEARRAVGLVRDRVRWRGWDWDGTWRGWEFVGNPFFAGEVEPCINGQVAASGAYFGQDVQRIVDRLLGEQLPDGGWNCEAANGSTRSSFNTTICVLEALLAYELAGGRMAEAIELVESKRDGDGRWPLENQHPGTMAVEVDEGEGRPSRWNTLRALRVLD